MARQELAIQRPSSGGLIPTWSTPTADGFKVSNDGDVHIHVKNGNAASCDVTCHSPRTIDGNTVANKVVAVAAGAEKEFIFPEVYNQPSNHADAGKIYLDFSVQTSVSVKATHK